MKQSKNLRHKWYVFDVPVSVDLQLPGIYEWRIGDTALYVGKSCRLLNRIKEYPNNVRKLLAGRPYRLSDPEGYRSVHHELRRAHDDLAAVTVTVLENCDRTDLSSREQHWISVRRAAAETGGPRILNSG